MKKLLTVVTALLAGSYCAWSQADGISAPRLQFQDITISTIFYNENNEYYSVQDFRKLAPGSALLNRDFATYRSRNLYSTTNGQGFSAMLGFSLARANEKNERFNQTLRLGLQGMDVSLMSLELGKITRVPLDTLSSPSLSNDIYVDSIYADNFWMVQTANIVALDASLILTTKPDKRFKIFVGAGISLGAKFNAVTAISRNQNRSVQTNFNTNSYTYYYGSNFEQVAENHRNRSGIYSTLYLPMGYSFRMGNKREFWRRLHLTGEMRPQVSVIGMPELGTRVTTSVFVQSGLRYNLGTL